MHHTDDSVGLWRASVGHVRVVGVVGEVFFEQRLGPVVQLLPLHTAILEPDFDLAFGEVELAADLPSLLAGDVGVVHEFVLQHHRLVARVRLPLLPLPGLI